MRFAWKGLFQVDKREKGVLKKALLCWLLYNYLKGQLFPLQEGKTGQISAESQGMTPIVLNC